MIFTQATLRDYGLARALVYVVLLADLVVDDLRSLRFLPYDAFVKRGVLQFIPDSWFQLILTDGALTGFTAMYAAVLVMGILGVGFGPLVTAVALTGTILFQGVARGFGGHSNHQELISLHALWFLLPREAFRWNPFCAKSDERSIGRLHDGVAQVMLRGLATWILLTYFYVGMARVESGGIHLYFTNYMNWAVWIHSNKWNYWNISLGRDVFAQPILACFLTMSFPVATVLELLAPVALVGRWWTPILIACLLGMHVLIWVFMNIFFWQSMVLLLIPLCGWWRDAATVGMPRSFRRRL